MLVTDQKLITAIQVRRISWASALMSGGYEQGKTYLKAYVGDVGKAVPQFCCLGVACELYANDVGVRAVNPVITHEGKWPVEYDAPGDSYFHSTFLPKALTDWLGLSHKSEALLAKMNDDGIPFPIIAQALEFLPIETS